MCLLICGESTEGTKAKVQEGSGWQTGDWESLNLGSGPGWAFKSLTVLGVTPCPLPAEPAGGTIYSMQPPPPKGSFWWVLSHHLIYHRRPFADKPGPGGLGCALTGQTSE